MSRPAGGLPLLLVDEPHTSGFAQLLKGTVERTSALVACVLLAPVFAVIAIAIKCTSPGPVLFRQTRVARDGRQFPMFKYRSMVDGAEHPTGGRFDEPDGRATSRPDVRQRTCAPAVGPEPAPRAAAEHTRVCEGFDRRTRGRSEDLDAGRPVLGQWELGGSGAQVGPENVRVVGVEHERLDRGPEKRVGMVDEIGVQWVVARDEGSLLAAADQLLLALGFFAWSWRGWVLSKTG